tara:strand:+ start:1913 stop:2233 length:321 start_codon:yes stop_codon:yes gene_type:complete
MTTKINYPKKRNERIDTEMILKYLIKDDDELNTKIMCKEHGINLVAVDKDVYEALGSIKKYDLFKLNKLTKFFEIVDVISFKERTGKEKSVLTFEKVDEIRKLALK